jgi:hypothetical protein
MVVEVDHMVEILFQFHLFQEQVVLEVVEVEKDLGC